jgi:metal-sulfur cluster biosynthetic enzyme
MWGKNMGITKEQIIKICKDYEDPELHIDIWSLGLVYNIEIKPENKVHLLITFTSPMCPFGPQMVDDLNHIIKNKGASEVEVEVTFEPAWSPPEDLREMLGL